MACSGSLNTPIIVSPRLAARSIRTSNVAPSPAVICSNISAPLWVLVNAAIRPVMPTTKAPTPVAIIAVFVSFNPVINCLTPATAPRRPETSPPVNLSAAPSNPLKLSPRSLVLDSTLFTSVAALSKPVTFKLTVTSCAIADTFLDFL